MYSLQFDPQCQVRKVQQIVQSITTDIQRGVLRHRDKLPSICELSAEYGVARDTVERAYRALKQQGFCTSTHGRGYFIQAQQQPKLKILLVVNKLSSYKKLIYDTFVTTLGEHARVDLAVHHNSLNLFADIISQNLGKYNHYVVMPHFTPASGSADCRTILSRIPAAELVLLDKNVPDYTGKCLRVFQDFDRDIFHALEGLKEELAKYERLVLVTPGLGSSYPPDIAWGFRSFCINHGKQYAICEDLREEPVAAGTAYIPMDTPKLAELLKAIQITKLVLGQEVGILSFNETPLKELLDITVISTDFEAMGRNAAQLLLNKSQATFKNPFHTIRRGSL
ncbi:GntR family transcriptional regulator [Hymenobacter tenuis]